MSLVSRSKVFSNYVQTRLGRAVNAVPDFAGEKGPSQIFCKGSSIIFPCNWCENWLNLILIDPHICTRWNRNSEDRFHCGYSIPNCSSIYSPISAKLCWNDLEHFLFLAEYIRYEEWVVNCVKTRQGIVKWKRQKQIDLPKIVSSYGEFGILKSKKTYNNLTW